MAEPRLGRQTPTQSVILPYYETKGSEAIELYNASGRIAQEWQELLLSDILSVIETRELKDGRVVTDSLISVNVYGF